MHSTIQIKSANQNSYLYDIEKKEFLISNPIFEVLQDIERNGVYLNNNLDDWEYLKSVNGDSKEKKYHWSELDYYYKKFNFLKSHGFFSASSYEQLVQGKVSKSSVERQIFHIRNVVFEVTDQCNLKCKYCTYGDFYDNYDKRINKLMDFGNIKVMLDFLYEKWNSGLECTSRQMVHIGFYGGEPLLNMGVIKETVEYIKGLENVKRDFIFDMTTNALLLDRHMKFLAENDFQLLISLDGNVHNQSYRVMHNGCNSFDVVYKNLKKLQSVYPEYFTKSVNFNSVLHDRNSIEEIHNFIYSEFKKIPQINVVNGAGIRDDKREAFDNLFKNINEDYENMADPTEFINKRFIADLNVLRLALFLRWKSNVVYDNYLELISKKNNYLRCPTGTCLPFAKKIFLTVNNKILACERIDQKFELGRITEGQVKIDYEKVGEIYNNYYDRLKEQCKSCYDADTCIQCMFQLDNLDGITRCPSYKTEQAYGKMIGDDITTLENYPYLYKKISEEVVLK